MAERTTESRSAAAKLGHERRKRGRPRKTELDPLPEELRAWPEDPLAKASLAMDLAHWLTFQAMEGKGNREQHDRMFRYLNFIIRAVPKERMHRAEQALRAGAAGPKNASKVRAGAQAERRTSKRKKPLRG